ncbi:MAG: serine/threonine-protein kinase [Georgenia sp.]
MDEERREVGGYHLLRRLGSGGMGTVHEAVDAEGRHVALKLLHPHIGKDPAARRRLEREVSLLHRVRETGVARVLDAEVEESEAFIVTELVDGPTLEEDVAADGPFTPDELSTLAHGLADALRGIHAVGVVHRDFKPGNVMMSDHGPVVIDFGIAQVADDVRLTQTGMVTGTPGYLDPEVIAGAEPSPVCDWWGWAAVLVFAATGRPPFGHGPTGAVLARVATGQVDVDGIAPAIARVLTGALAPEPADRLEPDAVLTVLDDVSGAPVAGDGTTTRLIVGSAGTQPDFGSTAARPAAGATRIVGASAAAPHAMTADAETRAVPVQGEGETGVLDVSAETRALPGGPPTRALPETPATRAVQQYAYPAPAPVAYPAPTPAPSSYPARPYSGGQEPGLAGREQPTLDGQPGYASTGGRPAQALEPYQQPGHPHPQPGYDYQQSDHPIQQPGHPYPQPGYDYQQSDHPIQQPGYNYPQPAYDHPATNDPEPEWAPGWASPAPRRTLTVATVGLGLSALASAAPGIFLVAAATLLVLTATTGWAGRSRRASRLRRGLRPGDDARMLAGLPWHLVRGAIGVVPGVLAGAGLGVVAWWVGTVLGGAAATESAVLWVAGLVGLGAAWLTPTSRVAREGARALVDVLTPTRSFRALLMTLVLAVVVVVGAQVALGQPPVPNWDPLPDLTQA